MKSLGMFIFICYAGGMLVVTCVDYSENFIRLKEHSLGSILFYGWGLFAASFGIRVWRKY